MLGYVDFSQYKKRRLSKPLLILILIVYTIFIRSRAKIHFLSQKGVLTSSRVKGLAPTATTYQMIRSKSVEVIIKVRLTAFSKDIYALLCITSVHANKVI